MSTSLPRSAVDRLLALGAPVAGGPELAPELAARYELGEEIGRGGMGVVHAAWDLQLGRTVALKLLADAALASDRARERFLREARAAAKLVHPNIAAVYDATPSAIAMQLVEGPTLDAMCGGDAREIAALVRDAALAVHFAHGRGVVHRDLKPANLMFETDETGGRRVYVMDFGLAKAIDLEASLSGSGDVLGTPMYMAPEQAASRPVDARADVYALGATLYHVLSGEPPFARGDVLQLLRDIQEAEPRPLRTVRTDLPNDLAVVVHKCLEKDPGRRYGSALELASDLDRWLVGAPVHARPPSAAYLASRFVSRRRAPFAVGAVALVILAIALGVLVPRARRARAEERAAQDALVLANQVASALQDERVYRGERDDTPARDSLSEAVRRCEDYVAQRDVAYVRYYLGRLHRALGHGAEAEASLERALELDPALWQARVVLGLVLADRIYEPGRQAAPPPELVARARALLATERAGPSDLDRVELSFADGQRARLGGDNEGAARAFHRIIDVDRTHAEAHRALSRIYFDLGDHSLGRYHAVVAVDVLRGFESAYDRPVAGRELTWRPVDATTGWVADFSREVLQEPNTAHAYGHNGQQNVERALRLAEAGDRADAIAAWELAVDDFGSLLLLSEGHVGALVSRAACRIALADLHLGLGDPDAARRERDRARADLDEAVTREPGCHVAYANRACLARRESELSLLAFRADEARAQRERGRIDVDLAREHAPDGWTGLANLDLLAGALAEATR